MGSTIIEQDFPYDILKRGQRDASRHNRRVEDAVKKQLKDIISQQDIITSEGNKKIKVKLKYLDEYRFRFNKNYIDRIGRDEFDDFQEGEILSKPEEGQSGQDTQATNDSGEEIYDAEFTIDELTDMMIEDLELPELDETKKNEIISEVIEFTDIQKHNGSFSSIDRKRTILSNILRRAKKKIPKIQKLPITTEDLVFRTWQIQQQKHSNAVVFLVADRSGSMGNDKIYAVKALYFWIVQFLKKKYDRVEIKFIAHDSVAHELDEKDFFSISDSGGTLISSAYDLCNKMMRTQYPIDQWNIYCFHSSDGDSFEDEDQCITLINEIMNYGVTLFAYTEILIDSWKDEKSDLYKKIKKLGKERDGILSASISDLSEIMKVLKSFLARALYT